MKVKQPQKCGKCGTELTVGKFGKGYCPNCRIYSIRICVDLVK